MAWGVGSIELQVVISEAVLAGALYKHTANTSFKEQMIKSLTIAALYQAPNLKIAMDCAKDYLNPCRMVVKPYPKEA